MSVDFSPVAQVAFVLNEIGADDSSHPGRPGQDEALGSPNSVSRRLMPHAPTAPLKFQVAPPPTRQTRLTLLNYFPAARQQAFAGVAQLVERQPSKLNVEGSSPFARFQDTWLSQVRCLFSFQPGASRVRQAWMLPPPISVPDSGQLGYNHCFIPDSSRARDPKDRYPSSAEENSTHPCHVASVDEWLHAV